MVENEELKAAIIAAARSFRLGMDAQASDSLTKVVDGLLGGAVEERVLTAASSVFSELLAAQERGDCIGLADRLEFELLPLMSDEVSAQPF